MARNVSNIYTNFLNIHTKCFTCLHQMFTLLLFTPNYVQYPHQMNCFTFLYLHSIYTNIYTTSQIFRGLTPLGLPSLCLLHLPSLGLLVILPLTPFGLLLVYPISLSMASWILGYGFMITCSVMPIMASV